MFEKYNISNISNTTIFFGGITNNIIALRSN